MREKPGRRKHNRERERERNREREKEREREIGMFITYVELSNFKKA